MRSIIKFAIQLAALATQEALCAVSIDLDTIAPGTLVRDQFLPLGLRLAGEGSFSGLVYAVGDYGTAPFGNSTTNIMDVGNRGQATTFIFVDPTNPSKIMGATDFSLLVENGDPDSETWHVTNRDIAGATLVGPATHTTTTNGVRLSTTAASLSGFIGSVSIVVVQDSQSGVTVADLSFTLSLPSLSIFTATNGVSITWPAAGTNYILEVASNLTTPVVWEIVTNEVQINGDMISVTIEADKPTPFFRVQKSTP